MKIVLIYEYGILQGVYVAKDDEEANKIFAEHIGIDFEEFEQDDQNYQSNAGSTIVAPTNSPCLFLQGFQGIIDDVTLMSSEEEAKNEFKEVTGMTVEEYENSTRDFSEKDWFGTKIMDL